MTGQSDLGRILQDISEKTGLALLLERREGATNFTLMYGGKGYPACILKEHAEEEARLVAYLVSSLRPAPDRDEVFRAALLGEGGREAAKEFMTRYGMAEGVYFALAVSVEKRAEEAFSHIEACLSESGASVVRMDGERIAVVQPLSEGQTPLELGGFLNQSLYEEIGVKAQIGIGCEVNSFSEIAASYFQAATALRMSALLGAKGDVHTYREFLLVKMLEDVPAERLREYARQFRIGNAEEIFSDEEMIATAEEFLENSLNVSETSRNLYMHRNTLMYRLDKIEKTTGLNIRNFPDAVTFRVVTILYKLLQL